MTSALKSTMFKILGVCLSLTNKEQTHKRREFLCLMLEEVFPLINLMYKNFVSVKKFLVHLIICKVHKHQSICIDADQIQLLHDIYKKITRYELIFISRSHRLSAKDLAVAIKLNWRQNY